MERENKSITFMLIPDDGGRVVRFRVSAKSQRVLFAAGVTLVSILSLTVVFALVAATRVSAYFSLKEQVAAQHEMLARMGHDVETLSQSVDRMKQFNRKMRVVLGFEQENVGGEKLVGIGGPIEARNDALESLSLASPSYREMESSISVIQNDSMQQEVELSDLHELMQGQASLLQSTPSVWPSRGWLTSVFGQRASPFTGIRRMHEGIDIASRIGAPAIATADGVVLFTGINGDYGKLIIVDHGFGITTYYGHLSQIEVKEGDRIKRGDSLGEVGNTGRSTGPHLHYEVRLSGVPVDPMRYILIE